MDGGGGTRWDEVRVRFQWENLRDLRDIGIDENNIEMNLRRIG